MFTYSWVEIERSNEGTMVSGPWAHEFLVLVVNVAFYLTLGYYVTSYGTPLNEEVNE